MKRFVPALGSIAAIAITVATYLAGRETVRKLKPKLRCWRKTR